MSCTHQTASDHSRVTQLGRAWKCSGCGHESLWSKGWTYFGLIECKRCWEAAIDRVLCPECKPSKNPGPPRA